MLKRNSKLRIGVLATVICLGAACASTTPPNAALDEARLSFAKAQSTGVADRAPLAFQQAEKTLGEAQTAYRDGEDAEKITHLAGLAQRQIETARAEAQSAQQQKELERLDAARTQVLLDARTKEVERLESELNAQKTERGLVVTLSDIFFDIGAATLKPGAELTLQRVADFLLAEPDRSVSVEGHADSMGSDAANRQLSQRRADAVAARLITLGVDPRRIRTVGFGESLPVAGNDTAAGRQENRRVELVIQNPVAQSSAR